MTWRVIGTRDRRYRVDTPDEIASWVDDELDSIHDGWVPLTSDRAADGSLRVTYGRTSPAEGAPAASLSSPPDVRSERTPRAPDRVSVLMAVGGLVASATTLMAVLARS